MNTLSSEDCVFPHLKRTIRQLYKLGGMTGAPSPGCCCYRTCLNSDTAQMTHKTNSQQFLYEEKLDSRWHPFFLNKHFCNQLGEIIYLIFFLRVSFYFPFYFDNPDFLCLFVFSSLTYCPC